MPHKMPVKKKRKGGSSFQGSNSPDRDKIASGIAAFPTAYPHALLGLLPDWLRSACAGHKTAQQPILGATSIRFRYQLWNDTVESAGSLKGFTSALNALAEPKSQEVAVASAGTPEAAPKKREPQFETLRTQSDPVPDALKKIYGVE